MRVVLGEDLTLLRDGLIRLLSAYDMEVVEAVESDLQEARQKTTSAEVRLRLTEILEALRPDVPPAATLR